MASRLYQHIPGLLLAIGVALLAKLLALVIPLLGAPAIAIFLGIILGNTYFKQPFLALGTRFAESRLLEYSIVMLGATVTIQTLIHLGINSLIFIVLQMSITIIAAIFIGYRLKFNQSISLLMASGNAVCGSSAIAATAPAIGATNEERGLVITIVNLMGTVMMFVMPLVSYLTYQQAPFESAALIGGTLQSVGQVIASASMISPEVTESATIFKIIRIMFLVVIVFLFSRIAKNNKENEANNPTQSPNPSIQSSHKKGIIPWYVYGFVITCAISSLGGVPAIWLKPIHFLSSWCEIIALAAIGLRLNFATLRAQGKAFALYGLILGAIQIISALTLVYLLLA